MAFWNDLGRPLALPAGTTAWQAGDPGDFALVLLEGELEVVDCAPSGDLLVLHRVEPGELVGEAACLEGGMHSATLRARTACRARRIPAGELRAAACGDPAHLAALLALQSGRVRRLSRQLALLGFDPVARRVARALAEAGPERLDLTHEELGQRVATTRESVTKALAWLAAQGLVERGRGAIRVLDRPRLEALLED